MYFLTARDTLLSLIIATEESKNKHSTIVGRFCFPNGFKQGETEDHKMRFVLQETPRFLIFLL